MHNSLTTPVTAWDDAAVKVHIAVLTVDLVHELADASLFPFAECPNCGVTPVSLNYENEEWLATCPGCEKSWVANTTNWYDVNGAKEAGWDLSPDVGEAPDVFDDRRNRMH